MTRPGKAGCGVSLYDGEQCRGGWEMDGESAGAWEGGKGTHQEAGSPVTPREHFPHSLARLFNTPFLEWLSFLWISATHELLSYHLSFRLKHSTGCYILQLSLLPKSI